MANCCDVMSRPLQESWPSLMRFVYPAATIKELNGHSPEWSEATIRPLELENNNVEALNGGQRERKVISIRSFLMCVHVAQFIYGPYGSLYSILKNPLKYKLEFIC